MKGARFDTKTLLLPFPAAKRRGSSPETLKPWVKKRPIRAKRTTGDPMMLNSFTGKTHYAEKAKASQRAPEAQHPLVLVVDDEASLRRLYQLAITAWGLPLRLETAENGIEGLNKAAQSRPHVLITDLHMPEMDGFQMLRRLRDISELSDTLLIVVTSMHQAEIESRGGLPSDLLMFPKPIPFDQLKQQIVNHLGLSA